MHLLGREIRRLAYFIRKLKQINCFSAAFVPVPYRAVYGVGLRPLCFWDCGFESRLGHGCLSLSLVSVVCYPVEVSAAG
jgi:hypothetical protein